MHAIYSGCDSPIELVCPGVSISSITSIPRWIKGCELWLGGRDNQNTPEQHM